MACPPPTEAHFSLYPLSFSLSGAVGTRRDGSSSATWRPCQQRSSRDKSAHFERPLWLLAAPTPA